MRESGSIGGSGTTRREDDIVQWSTTLRHSLAMPSARRIYKINVNPDGRAMEVIVEDDQLAYDRQEEAKGSPRSS
jgi:hypothetical protein